jgi:aryl-alcohol dehydrogenase-like predicted oxidoreductase
MLGGEIPVHRIGFGAMRITGWGIWGDPPDRDAAQAVLREAVGLGVNFIDTADSYGPGVSEDLIARALHPYASELVIGTKGGYERDGPFQWRADASPAHLRRSCEESLRRLRLDTIALYYLHAPDPAVPFEESIGALSDLRDQGKILHVGISNVDLRLLQEARRIVPIAAVQNRFNLAEREHEDLLRACEQLGVAFVTWFPLVKGALARARNRTLKRIAADHGATPAQIALAWLLHRSPATLPIPGTVVSAHLRENAASATIELSREEMDSLERFRPPRRIPQPLRRFGKQALKHVPMVGKRGR